ncbi:hypothetical protein IRT45_02970 [Nocardia sp. BSTN01]|uniref:hypothetical protein n=1 Tax=Nocardia sp. BSTN01 TaxID=2783665 RepID=UPI00188FF5BA|nr:hypothetical protein [Nocardia sp. BSTN01]MBF4996116.1 hypothetical protein [Nocardia sp. BSTN01]
MAADAIPVRYGFRLELVGSDATLTATQPGTFIHWGDWDIRISFETALRHHRLLAAIEQSAADGTVRHIP